MTAVHGPHSAPADWYPDPSGAPGLRYFDGTAWTAQTTTAEPWRDWGSDENVRAERRFTIHYGFALLAFLSLAATLTFGIPSLVDGFSNTTLDPTGKEVAGTAATFGVLWMLWGGMWTVIWAAFAIRHTLRGRNP